jgi:hypothetical protein
MGTYATNRRPALAIEAIRQLTAIALGKAAQDQGIKMNNSDDDIEEMVRSAIFLFAKDEAQRTAALQWLDERVTAYNAATDLGLFGR